MLKAKISWTNADKLRHEQNSVQQGFRSFSASLLLFQTFVNSVTDTTLFVCSIHNFQDVGKSILESYSRVLESLASNIVTRIDDLLNIDELNRHAEHFSPPGDADCKIACSQAMVPSFPVPASGTPFVTAYATPSFTPAQILSPAKKEKMSLTPGRRSQHSRVAGTKKAIPDNAGPEVKGMIINSGEMIDVSTTTEL